jgi:hypothetical protein
MFLKFPEQKPCLVVNSCCQVLKTEEQESLVLSF